MNETRAKTLKNGRPLYSAIDFKRIGSTLFILLIGFLVGGIVMLLGGFDPVQVYAKLFDGIFGSPRNIFNTIIKATPIIGTGLSIALANRCGMFNIGAEGQFTVGTMAAGLVGYFVLLPKGIHPIFVLLCAGIAGGIWGVLTGALKARFGISEVISGIMLNWIGMHLRNIIVKIPGFEKAGNANATYPIQSTAEIGFMDTWRNSSEGKSAIASNPILKDIFRTDINWGIVIVIAMAVIIWFLLNKTVLGYKIKAVGSNKFAAEYAGISVNKNIILSMFIAGCLAGISGGLLICGVQRNISYLSITEGYGFDGIAVALIGNSTPLGCVLSGLLLSALKFGGTKIQVSPINAPTEIINIMIGAIVLFAGMPTLLNEIGRRFKKRGAANSDVVNLDSINPDATNPDVVNPDVMNPAATNLDTVDLDGANPDAADPNPNAVNSDVVNPDAANPDATNLDTVNSDGANPDAARHDIIEQDTTALDMPEMDKVEAAIHETNESDATRSDATKPDEGKINVNNSSGQLDNPSDENAEGDARK